MLVARKLLRVQPLYPPNFKDSVISYTDKNKIVHLISYTEIRIFFVFVFYSKLSLVYYTSACRVCPAIIPRHYFSSMVRTPITWIRPIGSRSVFQFFFISYFQSVNTTSDGFFCFFFTSALRIFYIK